MRRCSARPNAAVLAAFVGSLLLVPMTVTGAYAHADLEATSPRDGSTVDRLPRTVTLTFSETLQAPAFVSVEGPAGDEVAVGRTRIRDARVSRRLGRAAGPGAYTVSYRVTSADGHPVTGEVRFRQSGAPGAGQSAPAAAPGDASDDGLGTGQLVLLLLGLGLGLAAVALGAMRALRGSRTSPAGASKRPPGG